MNEPNGADLLRTLIKLFAEQNQVNITYQLSNENGVENQ